MSDSPRSIWVRRLEVLLLACQEPFEGLVDGGLGHAIVENVLQGIQDDVVNEVAESVTSFVQT